jgi:hypothetical protein
MRAADSRRGQSRGVVGRRLNGPDRHGDDGPLAVPPGDEAPREGRWDQAWGGIASLGLALPVLWTAMHRRGIRNRAIGEWMAAAPATAGWVSGRKGRLQPGADADLRGLRSGCSWTVDAGRPAFSPQALAVSGRGVARTGAGDVAARASRLFADGFSGEPARQRVGAAMRERGCERLRNAGRLRP